MEERPLVKVRVPHSMGIHQKLSEKARLDKSRAFVTCKPRSEADSTHAMP